MAPAGTRTRASSSATAAASSSRADPGMDDAERVDPLYPDSVRLHLNVNSEDGRNKVKQVLNMLLGETIAQASQPSSVELAQSSQPSSVESAQSSQPSSVELPQSSQPPSVEPAPSSQPSFSVAVAQAGQPQQLMQPQAPMWMMPGPSYQSNGLHFGFTPFTPPPAKRRVGRPSREESLRKLATSHFVYQSPGQSFMPQQAQQMPQQAQQMPHQAQQMPMSSQVPMPMSSQVPMPMPSQVPMPMSSQMSMPMSSQVPVPMSSQMHMSCPLPPMNLQ